MKTQERFFPTITQEDKSHVTMEIPTSDDEYDFTALLNITCKVYFISQRNNPSTCIFQVFSVCCHGNLSRLREPLFFKRKEYPEKKKDVSS